MHFGICDINLRASPDLRRYRISEITTESENVIEKRATLNERIRRILELEKSSRLGAISWSISGWQGRRWWSVAVVVVAVLTRRVEEFGGGCCTSSSAVGVTREKKKKTKTTTSATRSKAEYRGGMKRRQE
ncbi:hypothetical protein X777_10793 [Ooceraea biroi]|uniref:Uncharacterized protein n=1 Tax=Ooceraea biroi TaxID=2015173 RepID=A0A026W412_OOCBI|nr:hypothetical protein X777_10793 [Ooceraea biroi]